MINELIEENMKSNDNRDILILITFFSINCHKPEETRLMKSIDSEKLN